MALRAQGDSEEPVAPHRQEREAHGGHSAAPDSGGLQQPRDRIQGLTGVAAPSHSPLVEMGNETKLR
jgi:hypothetical protein